jgi:ATP-dependent Clp protease ATP-binding subunit ClpC
MAGTASSGSPPFTPRAKKVLEYSLREALQLGHSYIGTEHILLGLVREGDGVAAAILVSLGADPGQVRQRVMQLMSGQSEEEHSGVWEGTSGGNPSFSPEPRCPQCRGDLAEVARFRTIGIGPDLDNDVAPISVHVVYCTRCGATLQMLRSDPPAPR